MTSKKPLFWQSDSSPIPVAHRGGDLLGQEKENSLAAVEAAVRLGYEWFETDVVPTSDGKLLAIHGRGYQMHPNRDLPTRGRIQEMSYAEVQRDLKIGGETPPLLEELLKQFPATKWFIDPKVDNAVEPLIKILSQPSIGLDRITVGAFSQKRTDAIASAIKEKTGQDVCTVMGPLGAYAILKVSDVKVNELELRDRVVLASLVLAGKLNNTEAMVKNLKATSVSIPYRWVNNSSDFVDISHSYGIHVAVWTPNKREDILASVAKGVDAVMSDNIKELREIILASKS